MLTYQLQVLLLDREHVDNVSVVLAAEIVFHLSRVSFLLFLLAESRGGGWGEEWRE